MEMLESRRRRLRLAESLLAPLYPGMLRFVVGERRRWAIHSPVVP